jgi:membrane associated rhomboid family serine protease
VWGLRYPADKFGWLAAVGLWCTMLGAIFVHFQKQKRRTAFPAGFLLILITILLVIKQ